ncbi:MAG: hypothetical protein Q7R40_12285 [Phaeospirillum sp.]|nr:hypothetical protein [Phaeospirillum sp.]
MPARWGRNPIQPIVGLFDLNATGIAQFVHISMAAEAMKGRQGFPHGPPDRRSNNVAMATPALQIQWGTSPPARMQAA